MTDRYRQLGSSDLQISAIGLGTWKIYGGGGVSDDRARGRGGQVHVLVRRREAGAPAECHLMQARWTPRA